MSEPGPAESKVLDALAGLVAMRLANRRDSGRLTLTKTEAAEALGVSVDHFERHVQPELRVIRSGRLVLVPVRDLERWADEHATLTFEPSPGSNV